MKIFGRIIYALAVAILIFPVVNTATNTAASKYFSNEGKEIYLSDSEDKYRMFYGSTGYHLNEATYKYIVNDYQIQFFEINKVFQKEDDIKVEEYYYIIIDHPTIVLTTDNPQRYYLRFISGDEIKADLRIHQFDNIPFSVVVDEDDRGLLDAYSLIDENIDTIQIIDYRHEISTNVLAEFSTSFDSDDLIIKNEVVENHSNEEYLNSKGINYRYQINSSKYNYIIWLFVGGYVLLVLGFTYWLYFTKRD